MACVLLYRRPSDRCRIGLQHGRLNCCCLGAGSVGNVCIRWYHPNSHTGPIGGYRQSGGRCGRQFFMRLPVIHIAGCRAAVREYSPDLREKRRTWVFVIISHETRSSPARRNLMFEYPNLSISLTRPSIRRVVQKKSEHLASEGRFREKLRFSVVRVACSGRRESRNINDSGLPTISDNPRGILINLQIALLREILRLFSQRLSGNGILLEFFTFRRWGGRLGATPTEYRSATRLAAAKQNSPQPDAAPRSRAGAVVDFLRDGHFRISCRVFFEPGLMFFVSLAVEAHELVSVGVGHCFESRPCNFGTGCTACDGDRTVRQLMLGRVKHPRVAASAQIPQHIPLCRRCQSSLRDWLSPRTDWLTSVRLTGSRNLYSPSVTRWGKRFAAVR